MEYNFVVIGQVLTLPTKGGEVLLLGIPYADIELERTHFEKILRNELNAEILNPRLIT